MIEWLHTVSYVVVVLYSGWHEALDNGGCLGVLASVDRDKEFVCERDLVEKRSTADHGDARQSLRVWNWLTGHAQGQAGFGESTYGLSDELWFRIRA